MVDQEGGRVARFREPHFTTIPSAETVGNAADDAAAARVVGDVVRKECRVNVDMTLAPVVDVNTNPRNVVIGNRAFGSNSEAVGATASAFIRACQSRGVAACAKHWPGHGDRGRHARRDGGHEAQPRAASRRGDSPVRGRRQSRRRERARGGTRVPGMEAERRRRKKIAAGRPRSAAVVVLRASASVRRRRMSDDMEMGALLNEEGAPHSARWTVCARAWTCSWRATPRNAARGRDALRDASRRTRRPHAAPLGATDALAKLPAGLGGRVRGRCGRRGFERARARDERPRGRDVRPRGRAGGREARADAAATPPRL